MSNPTIYYTSPKYEPSGAVKHFDWVPRFGHTENFYEFVDGDRKNYIVGVMFIPGLVAAITIIWLTFLAAFMSICRKSSLSGRGFSSGEGAITRTIFLFSVCAVLISSMMFLTFGGNSFIKAFDDFEGSKENLFAFTNEGIQILASIRIDIGNLTEGTLKLQEKIAEGVFEDIPQEVNDMLDDISSTIISSNYTKQLYQLEDFEDGLKQSFSTVNQLNVDELLEEVERNLINLRYGALPSLLTSFILGCGAVLSWYGLKSDMYSYFQDCFILPLFLCVELIASAITSLLGVVLVIFADLCTGGEDQSPEGSLKIILDDLQYDGVVQQAIEHYIINGCRTASPFGGLIETENALKNITHDINEMREIFQVHIENAYSNSTELNVLLSESNDALNNLNYALEKGLKVTSCENINSMFVDGIHQGTCKTIPDAIGWMFLCFFVVWVGGLLMLSTRAASRPSHKNDEKGGTESNSLCSGTVGSNDK